MTLFKNKKAYFMNINNSFKIKKEGLDKSFWFAKINILISPLSRFAGTAVLFSYE